MWILKCQLLKAGFRRWSVDYCLLIELKWKEPEQLYQRRSSVLSGILIANNCWLPFWTLQCAQPQVPCQVKTALGSFGVYCAVCLLVRGFFPATGITVEWSFPYLCNRRVLCQHWLQGMHCQGPKRNIRSCSGCAQHHCRSLTSLACLGLAGGSAVVRGGSLGGTAGLLQLDQPPSLVLLRWELQEGGSPQLPLLSCLNLRQGRPAPYSLKEPFLLVPCQVWIQSAFHFRLSGTDFNDLLQKSLQNININALINRNHNTMQIQLV